MLDNLAKKNPHNRDNCIKFDEGPHIYTVNGSTNNTSVTTWCHKQFSPFNPKKVIERMMASPKWPENKYYGQTADEIAAGWKQNGIKAAADGTKMHKMIEEYYQYGEFKTPLTCTGPELNLFKEFLKDNTHLTPYRAEWMIWDNELQLAGSIDMVFKTPSGNFVIYDWKRCKDIKKTPVMGKFSRTSCISHIPDTNYWHYALQLNTYKAILEKNYNIHISEMALVQLHPEQTTYKIFTVPDLQNELNDLFKIRLSQITRELK